MIEKLMRTVIFRGRLDSIGLFDCGCICEFITNFYYNEWLRFHRLIRFTRNMAFTVKIDTSQNKKIHYD
jgi:hypothetical protein